MSEINIEELAKQIADRVRPAVPIEYALWDIAEVAAYMHKSADVVRNRIACLPSFPKPIRTPALREGKMTRGHPVYKAIEVIRWNEGQREQKAGAPRKAG